MTGKNGKVQDGMWKDGMYIKTGREKSLQGIDFSFFKNYFYTISGN
jgi:hypothetical protein